MSSSAFNRVRSRVLIVEDNPLSMKMFSDLLEARGCEIFQAGTATKAARLVHEHHPDLILMDVQLPDGSGLDLTRSLKRAPRTKDIPIIVVTASGVGQREADDSGCDAYLEKPIMVDAFLHAIDGFLFASSTARDAEAGPAALTAMRAK